ncbi:MAG: hypothetical protein IKK10_04445 [Clostridia bacterium]|nr:hypothetical protein [Clostridia bacterium]
MKPFLGIDISTNTENEIKNGTELLTQTTPPELLAKLENATNKLEKVVKKAELPGFWQFVHFVTGLLGFIFGIGAVGSLIFGTFREGIKNAPWLYITFLVCLVIWTILTLIGSKKKNKVYGAKENLKTKDDALGVYDEILNCLGVPENAEEVDILCCRYKIENGQPKVFDFPTQPDFLNLNFSIYKDTHNLYLANTGGKYAFPLNSLRTIRTIGEGATIPSWYKDKSYQSEEFKPYGFFKNRFGVLCVPNYHILELVANGELLWIYFPNYEIRTIENLTGLKAWGE